MSALLNHSSHLRTGLYRHNKLLTPLKDKNDKIMTKTEKEKAFLDQMLQSDFAKVKREKGDSVKKNLFQHLTRGSDFIIKSSHNGKLEHKITKFYDNPYP